MLPEIPADLSALSDAELSALLDALVAFATAAAGSEDHGASMATELGTVAAGAEAVRAEAAAREAAAEDTASAAQAALARILPPASETPPAGEPAPEGEPAPVVTGESGDLGPVLASLATAVEHLAARTPAVTAAARPGTPSLAEIGQQRPSSGLDAAMAAEGAYRTPAERSSAAATRTAPPIEVPSRIVAGGNLPHTTNGTVIPDVYALHEAIVDARPGLDSPGTGPNKITVASVRADWPEERMLRYGEDAANARKVAAVVGNRSLTASGGLCVPAIPYFDIQVVSGAARPIRDSLPSFGVERGGLQVVPPPVITDLNSATRTAADVGTTNTSPAITSPALAQFDQRDVGAAISGTGIPASTVILSVQSATAATMSNNATATGTITATITRKGSVAIITTAQDLAALNAAANSAADLAALKPCLHVTCPGPNTIAPYAVSRCVRFGNFQARAYPEQQPAWLALSMAVWARVAETKLLDALSAASTAVDSAHIATLGAARELPVHIMRAVAYLRNRHRMDNSVPIRVVMPAWARVFCIIDLLVGSGYEMEYYSQAAQQVDQAIAQANVNMTWHLDSGTGKAQYMGGTSTPTVQAAGSSPVTFPTTLVFHAFPEGSFLFGDGGELDFGLTRDSTLNQRNEYQIQTETFELLAPVGVEALEFTTHLVASGSAAPLSTAITGI